MNNFLTEIHSCSSAVYNAKVPSPAIVPSPDWCLVPQCTHCVQRARGHQQVLEDAPPPLLRPVLDYVVTNHLVHEVNTLHVLLEVGHGCGNCHLLGPTATLHASPHNSHCCQVMEVWQDTAGSCSCFERWHMHTPTGLAGTSAGRCLCRNFWSTPVHTGDQRDRWQHGVSDNVPFLQVPYRCRPGTWDR